MMRKELDPAVVASIAPLVVAGLAVLWVLGSILWPMVADAQGPASYGLSYVSDGYAEVKWHDNSTATELAEISSDWSNEAAVAGGSVDETLGFNVSGGTLITQPAFAGLWELHAYACFTGGASDSYEFSIKTDSTRHCSFERKLGLTASGVSCGSSVCIVDLAGGDTVDLYVQITFKTGILNNVTVREGGIFLRRL